VTEKNGGESDVAPTNAQSVSQHSREVKRSLLWPCGRRMKVRYRQLHFHKNHLRPCLAGTRPQLGRANKASFKSTQQTRSTFPHLMTSQSNKNFRWLGTTSTGARLAAGHRKHQKYNEVYLDLDTLRC